MGVTTVTAAQLVSLMNQGLLVWPPFFFPTDGHIYALSSQMDPLTKQFIVYQV